MCLAIPYEVVELRDSEKVLVRVGSGVQSCFVGLVDEVKKGDWLLIHAGFAIEKITPQDARKNLELLARYVDSSPPLKTASVKIEQDEL